MIQRSKESSITPAGSKPKMTRKELSPPRMIPFTKLEDRQEVKERVFLQRLATIQIYYFRRLGSS
jgi:hypothetical protein